MEKEQLRPRIPPEARKKKAGGEVLAQSASEYIEAHYTEIMSGELPDDLRVVTPDSVLTGGDLPL